MIQGRRSLQPLSKPITRESLRRDPQTARAMDESDLRLKAGEGNLRMDENGDWVENRADDGTPVRVLKQRYEQKTGPLSDPPLIAYVPKALILGLASVVGLPLLVNGCEEEAAETTEPVKALHLAEATTEPSN